MIYWLTSRSDHMSQSMTKPSKWPLRPAKTQISLGVRPVGSESSLGVQWVAKDPQDFFKPTAKTLIRLGECPGWSESSCGAHTCIIWSVLSCCGLYYLQMICVWSVQYAQKAKRLTDWSVLSVDFIVTFIKILNMLLFQILTFQTNTGPGLPKRTCHYRVPNTIHWGVCGGGGGERGGELCILQSFEVLSFITQNT